MASKRFKGKTCAYCAAVNSSTTGDHIIAREFFFVEDRDNLPQVPACETCNNEKSKLEHYVLSVLPIASRLPTAERYRKEMVRPRLAKNAKLRNDMGLDLPPRWVNLDGVVQPMHPVPIEAAKITTLMALIARGLYSFHFNRTLAQDATVDAAMMHPDGEVNIALTLRQIFPATSPKVTNDLGNSTFSYTGVMHPVYPVFSTWQFAFYGGVTLHGSDGTGANYWRVMTRPSPSELEAARRSSMD